MLEDGHWADASTLLLLRHLARAAGDARVLLLATFRDTEADVPEALSETLADLRRSDDVVRLRLAGLSDDEVAEFVRHAAGGDAGAGLPELARAIGELTGGNAFLVCELWRALVETGIVEVVDGTIRLTRPLGASSGRPESVREVVSQRLSRLAPADDRPARAHGHRRRGVRARHRPPGRAASSEPELLAALDEAVRSGMIEELPSRAARLPLHPRARAPRALRPALRAAAGGAAPARRRGARGARRGARAARSPTSRTTSPPPRRSASPDAASSTTSAPRGRPPPRSPSTRRRRGCAPRSSCGSKTRAERAEVFLELGTASHRAGKALDALRGVHARRRRSPASWATRELLARAAIGYEDACWRPGIADQGAVELLEEAAAALGDESSELRVGLLGGLARALDFQGEHERGAIVRTNADRDGPASCDDRAGLATVLMRSYWSRGTSSLEEILAMLTEAMDLGEELGDTEILAEAMAWRVPAFVALGDLESARREVAALLRDRRADGPAVHAPRRRALRLGDRARATGASRRPRRGRGARTSGAGC